MRCNGRTLNFSSVVLYDQREKYIMCKIHLTKRCVYKHIMDIFILKKLKKSNNNNNGKFAKKKTDTVH